MTGLWATAQAESSSWSCVCSVMTASLPGPAGAAGHAGGGEVADHPRYVGRCDHPGRNPRHLRHDPALHPAHAGGPGRPRASSTRRARRCRPSRSSWSSCSARVVQGPRRVREPAAAGRAARGSGGGLRRQPRRGRGLRRAPPRRAGQDLRAHRVRPGQDGAHPAARRGARGDRRAVRRRAGRRAGLGAELGRDERARLRPAGDPARPGHPGPGAGRAGRRGPGDRAWTPCWCRSAAAG